MPTWEYRIPNGAVPDSLRNVSPPLECIYCGSKHRLSTEHVVPRGMGGRLTIPNGSCEVCRERILAFETECMRRTLLQPRLANKLHRHPHEAPKLFPLVVTNWVGHQYTTHVDAEEYPCLWIMPVLETPAVLIGLTEDESTLGILAIKSADDSEAKFQRLLTRPGVKSVSVTADGIRVDWFARWLAKIAFGFAVACLGLPNVRTSELRTIIRDGAPKYGYLVGGLNDLRLPSAEYRLRREDDSLFAILLTDMVLQDRTWWVVQVRLFGRLQTPDYLIVIGAK